MGALKNAFEEMLRAEDDEEIMLKKQASLEAPTLSIDDTLAERGSRYGSFVEHARITQNIKRAMRDSPNWDSLPDDMKEALEMDAHKTGRILNGDPTYHDSWHDKIGYTKLVADTLLDKQS